MQLVNLRVYSTLLWSTSRVKISGSESRRVAKPSEALRICLATSDAIAEAHKHGVLHRDLASEHSRPQRYRVRVVDFGLAKELRLSPTAAKLDHTDPPDLQLDHAW